MEIFKIFLFGYLLPNLCVCWYQAPALRPKCPEQCNCTGIKIDCSDNEILSITYLDALYGANIVDLSGNEIEMIADFTWTGIEQLQFLYLNINSIIYVADDAFRSFINLEYLDLSNNFLEILPSRMIDDNGRLETLKLQGNLFGDNVPILYSSSLTHLDLSFCKLTHFSYEHVEHMPKLNVINLRVNNLMALDPTVFVGHHLESLELSYNIWACNCSTVDLFKWTMTNPDTVFVQDFMCATKNNIYIDLNATQFWFKENCDINESYFDSQSAMKNLSLVRDNVNDNEQFAKNPGIMDKNRLYDEAFLVFVLTAISVICVAILVGIVIGVYLGNKIQRRPLKNHNECLLKA